MRNLLFILIVIYFSSWVPQLLACSSIEVNEALDRSTRFEIASGDLGKTWQ